MSGLQGGSRLAAALAAVTLTLWALAPAQAPAQTMAAHRQMLLDAFANDRPEPSLARMPPVERLLERRAVEDLVLRYARCTSQKDTDCLEALFSPDFQVTHPTIAGQVLHGGAGQVQLLRGLGILSEHVVSIIHSYGAEVELLSPTRARARWAAEMVSYAEPAAGGAPAAGRVLVAPGAYQRVTTVFYQTFEKSGGAWRIRTNMHLDLLREERRDELSLPVMEAAPK